MTQRRMREYTTVTERADITPEILAAAESVYDGWYSSAATIDWQDFLDRLDGMELADGSRLDLGSDMLSPAIRSIKAHVRRYKDC